jgi:hypothetical protein
VTLTAFTDFLDSSPTDVSLIVGTDYLDDSYVVHVYAV